MSGPTSTDAPDPLRSEAAARVEHEVGTALTAVRGYVGLLLRESHGRLNPEQWSFASEIRRAADRVGHLVANLLELAKGRDAEPVRKPLRLRDCLAAAAASAWPLLESRGLELADESEAVADRVVGDPDALERVFINLLANAARYAPAGSTVRIATTQAELSHGPVLCVAVSDEGEGVDESMAERIFQPYVRGGSAVAGVGLGLAVCRQIVEAHGGSIEAVPSAGYGLFRVVLPAAVED